MKLRERLDKLKGNPMICLGAKASYLMIAPKNELMFWLQENETSVAIFNELLKKDQKQGKRMEEEPKSAFLDREVRSEEWNDLPHHALIILIKGNEYGQYATRGEVVGEDLTKDIKVTSESGCEWLIDEVLADFAHDITDYLLFEQIYHKGELNIGGKAKHASLKRSYVIASEFFRSEALSRWTDISGDWIIKQAEKDVPNRVRDLKRRVCRLRAWEQRLDGLYTATQKDRIVDLIIEGITPSKIIEEVGKGKGELATPEMFKNVYRSYEGEMLKEAKRYLSGDACLEMDIPLKRQMKINNEKLEQNLRERRERAIHDKLI